MKLRMKKIEGDEVLEFVAFNFDGNGTCLIYDEKCEVFETRTSEEVRDIFLGKNACNIEYKLLKE